MTLKHSRFLSKTPLKSSHFLSTISFLTSAGTFLIMGPNPNWSDLDIVGVQSIPFILMMFIYSHSTVSDGLGPLPSGRVMGFTSPSGEVSESPRLWVGVSSWPGSMLGRHGPGHGYLFGSYHLQDLHRTPSVRKAWSPPERTSILAFVNTIKFNIKI